MKVANSSSMTPGGCFFGHHFVHSLSRVHRWHVATWAPAQSSGKSREKVGERAGRRSGPVSRGRKEVDITVINVRVFSFRPPPVGQVKQLMREERTVERQVSSSGEVAQEVSTLPRWTSAALCDRLLRDTAERRHPPSPKGRALVSLRPRCPQSCSRGGDCHKGVLTVALCVLLVSVGTSSSGHQQPRPSPHKNEPGNQRLDGGLDCEAASPVGSVVMPGSATA